LLKEKTKFKETEIGLIPEDWEFAVLGDIARVQNGYAFKSNEFSDHGIPVIKIKNIASGSITTDDLNYYNGPTDKLNNFIVSKGDVLVSMTGSHISQITSAVGKVARYDLEQQSLLNQRVGKIYPSELKTFNDYLYYLVVQPEVQLYWGGKAGGSANQANISPSIILSYPFALPPLLEQKAIAAVLSSLDDKIELLRGQNKTLEAIAQALFKEWFIDFNFPDDNGKPYRKSGGVMIDSELGEIPEGWRVGVLNELMSNILPGEWGKDASDKDYAKEVYCVRGTDLCDIRYGSDLRTPRRFIQQKKFNQVKLRDGDIVIEISGGTEGQSTGRACYINNGILTRLEQDIVAVNFCKTLRPKERCTYWIFMLLNYLYDKGIFFNWENGTTGIKNLALKEFLIQHLIAIPDKQPLDLICRFNEICLLFYKRIQENNKQIDFIKSTRNILLPKLMKGEIRVKNINSNDE
jgi:type I restriction enzyme, S subunit